MHNTEYNFLLHKCPMGNSAIFWIFQTIENVESKFVLLCVIQQLEWLQNWLKLYMYIDVFEEKNRSHGTCLLRCLRFRFVLVAAVRATWKFPLRQTVHLILSNFRGMLTKPFWCIEYELYSITNEHILWTAIMFAEWINLFSC